MFFYDFFRQFLKPPIKGCDNSHTLFRHALTVFFYKFVANHQRKVRRANSVRVQRDKRNRFFFCRFKLFFRNVSRFAHACQRKVFSHLKLRAVCAVRGEVSGGVRKRGEVCRFCNGKSARRFIKICAARLLNAVDISAIRRFIQVKREYFVFSEHFFQFKRKHPLFQFARNFLLASQEGVFHHLLSDCGAALSVASAAEISKNGTRNRPRFNAVVLIKPNIF